MFLFCTSGTVLPSVAGIYFISDYLLQKMENRRKKLQSRTTLEHVTQKVWTNSLGVKIWGSVNHLSYGWFALKGNSITRYSNALSVIFKCVWATTQLGDISLSPAPAIVVLKDRPHQESISFIQVSIPVFLMVTFTKLSSIPLRWVFQKITLWRFWCLSFEAVLLPSLIPFDQSVKSLTFLIGSLFYAAGSWITKQCQKWISRVLFLEESHQEIFSTMCSRFIPPGPIHPSPSFLTRAQLQLVSYDNFIEHKETLSYKIHKQGCFRQQPI